MPATLRLSRAHLRYLAAMERGGPVVVLFMTVIPIFINFIWTIIYFKERTDDVYSYGPCKTNGTAKYATPFFITNRSAELWATQAVFTLLTVFVWAPYRYLRPRANRNILRTGLLLLVDFVTLFPFMLSLVFIPAYVSYVPTFLRVWVVKYEALSLLSRDRKIQYLITYLFMDILSITISVIGAFEWSMNNFPADPVDLYGGTLNPTTTVYPCLTFFDSLYWFMVTFATVGYGDVVPVNVISRMLVALFIVIFLLLLPEFVNKATSIVRSYSDLREARFTNTHKRDFVVLEGNLSARGFRGALAMLQPKYFTGEQITSYLVAMTQAEEVDDLLVLRDFRAEEYTRFVLLRGSLDVAEDAERARVDLAKAVYVLPGSLRHIPYPTAHHKERIALREATEQIREFAMRRDFDTIRRIWSTQMHTAPMNSVCIRTVLMHKANASLINATPLEPLNAKICRCTNMTFLYADTYEQRIGAASALIPAYGTILVLLILGGSCAHKSFEEFEAEATSLAAIDKIYESTPGSGRDFIGTIATQESARSLTAAAVSANIMKSVQDDEQFVRSLRSTLLLIRFRGAPATLGRICRNAYEARVLVLATVPSFLMCSHENFKSEYVVWSHSAAVMTDDWLVCFGTSHQIDIIIRSAFWQFKEEENTLVGLARSNGESALISQASAVSMGSDAFPSGEGIRTKWTGLHEGESDSSNPERYLLNTTKRGLRIAQVRDARPVDESSSSDSTGDSSDNGNANSNGVEGELPERPRSKRPNRTSLENHIIVSSASHDDYVFFVRKLRARDLIDSSIPILLFDSKPPNRFHWREIAAFGNVYFLQGRPFVLDDLRRAGFEKAKALVLLTDFRAGFEIDTYITGAHIDRDHLLAEKVARRLKRELKCSTRIITHLARAENCDYVGVDVMRRVGFQKASLKKETSEASRKRNAFDALTKLFEQAWNPVTHSSFICGDAWSPSSYILSFLAVESKGKWIMSFLEALTDSAGTRFGLGVEQVPLDCLTFDDVIQRMFELDKGLVIGIFRNYFDISNPATFRGCILFPDANTRLTSHDLLFVIRGADAGEGV